MDTNPTIPILNLKPGYQRLKSEFDTAITRVLENTAFVLGPEVKSFEQEMSEYLGVKHAIGVNSGTDALVIGLRAMGIGEGDEVITVPFTFFATAESINMVGAKPIFVDVEDSTMNIDPQLIEAVITEKTKAIMPVHLFGLPANMDAILDIAAKHNLKVIEDCAQSTGATFNGKQTGTMGTVGAFSFFPTKNLGAYGDGGMIVTDDDSIADRASMLRVHGAKKKYYNEMLGYNSRLDAMQAAILRVKLPHLDEYNKQRRRVASTYNANLESCKSILTPPLQEGHVFHQYTIRITNGKRNAIHDHLKSNNIHPMIYYEKALHQLPVYEGGYGTFPVSERLSEQVMSLPIWPELEDELISRICTCILEAC